MSHAYDTDKFDLIHQLGGIQTGSLDHPQPQGGQACRVALFNAGPLRFTVALDRGGDIVEATCGPHSLAYLTPNGYAPPSDACCRGLHWLDNWTGGLVTTCGPLHIGAPDPHHPETSLHGHHHNRPAAILAVTQPDPGRGRLEMSLDLLIRDTRAFGPVVEVRRRISATLGQTVICIHDEVTNRGNTACPHHWLYHCNAGYPLLDEGARLLLRGQVEAQWNSTDGPAGLELRRRPRRVPGPLPRHVGGGESGAVLAITPDRQGVCRAALVNDRLEMGLELSWPARQLPRMANWHHFGPGSYVMGLEPFRGALLRDDAGPAAGRTLKPGRTQRYDLTLTIHHDRAALKKLERLDGPVDAAR